MDSLNLSREHFPCQCSHLNQRGFSLGYRYYFLRFTRDLAETVC